MKIKIFLFLVTSLVLASSIKISAATDCVAPYFIPDACAVPYIPGKSPGYTADLNCQIVRITKPGTTEAQCCPNICVDTDGTRISATLPTEVTQTEVFGTNIRINPDSAGTIINILFTTVLGLVSVYAIIRGIYVTGVKRPMAIEAEKIAEINKELTNLVIGLIISWGFIILIQVVANLLGVGQLSNLDISGGESGGTVITIK